MSYDYNPGALRIPDKYNQTSSPATQTTAVHSNTINSNSNTTCNTNSNNNSLSLNPSLGTSVAGRRIDLESVLGRRNVLGGVPWRSNQIGEVPGRSTISQINSALSSDTGADRTQNRCETSIAAKFGLEPSSGLNITPADIINFSAGFNQFDSISPAPVSVNLSKLIDQKSPPNVVINYKNNIPSVLTALNTGGSSSPEPEETKLEGEGPAPPNITISSHKLELGFNSSSSQSTSNIISSMDTPLFNLQVIPDGIGNGRNLISTLGEHSLLSELVKNISNIGDQHIVSRVWEIQNFSTIFKTIRVTAGFGLADVVDAISLIFGPEIDEITLSRFESLNIPLGRGLKIKPMLEKWVESIKSKRSSFMKKISSKTSSSDSEPDQKRFFGRKRTKIEARNREYMETVFIQCPKPTYEQLITISTNTSLDRDVVRVWFSNRRQKEKRKKDNRGTASEVSFVRREYDLKASIHPSPSCLLVHRPGAGSTFQPDRDFNLTPVQDLDQLSQEGRADLGLNGRNSFKMKPEPVFQPENTALDFDTRYFSTLESKPKQEMHPSSPNQQTQSLNYPGVNLTFPTHNMTSSSNTLSSSKEVRPGYAQNDDLGRMEEFDSEDSSLSLVDEEGEAGRKVPERASIKEETEFSVSQDTRQSTGSPSDPGKKSVIVENSFVRSNTGRTYTEDLLDNPLLMTPKVDDEQNRSEEDWEQFF